MISQNNLRERLQRFVSFIKFHVLHIDDTPHRIALGIALGLFIAWTPLIGLHIFLALILAFLLRANKFTAITFVWVSNPLTFIPIYYPNYLFGKKLLTLLNPASAAQSADSQNNHTLMLPHFADIFTADFWNNIFIVLFKQGQALWLGSVILGLFVGGAGYLLTYLLIKSHRKKLLLKSLSANR